MVNFNLIRISLIITGFSVHHVWSQVSTQFWYGPRPVDLNYDSDTYQNQHINSLPYANLTVKINRSIYDGPGQNLMTDPLLNTHEELFIGNTINKQSFETQFVLDMQYALGISVDRVYVTSITAGDVHHTWLTENVIVEFIFIERSNSGSISLLQAISDLTVSIQNSSSLIYRGTNVTVDIDSLYGVQVANWDVSLKLSYAIEVIGGNETIDEYYLNQGGQELCQTPLLYDYPLYCEFERFFEDDISHALQIDYRRVQVLFIKKAALDAVLIHFRIIPPINSSTETSIAISIATLIEQVHNPLSLLYQGNVTVRVDPIWGVSNSYGTPRTSEALFTHKHYEIDGTRQFSKSRMRFDTAYDRCKANRRCSWGITVLNQTSNEVEYFHRLFSEGHLFNVSIFLDFEDWRLGTRGLSRSGIDSLTISTNVSSQADLSHVLPGAHFWPFNETSLGPIVPAYRHESNEGLVLDRYSHLVQIDMQEAFVDDLEGRLSWIDKNIDSINMGASLRARRDVHLYQNQIRGNTSQLLMNEIDELIALNSSQCTYQICELLFNTSSLEMTGAINATGVLRKTSNGTEVALFAFNSIYLGPEVGVTLVGQRALVLTSRTSIVINTTLLSHPGTIGGFPGGGSIARLANDTLIDNPRLVMICDVLNVCDNSQPYTNYTDDERQSFISNNVNGPGSGNLRVYPFVLTTTAKIQPEIQFVSTKAREGQTLCGGFVLHFKSYQTPVIPHDVSSVDLKKIIESNLNAFIPGDVHTSIERTQGSTPGVGIVEVSRSVQNEQEGFEWQITFVSAIGNVDQLTVTSYLQGLQAEVVTGTVREGNEISGSFVLEFNGFSSAPISATESADGFRQKLLAMPSVSSAYVDRIDPTGKCDDGLCQNGPLLSRGYIWTAFVTSNEEYGNASPYSPTSLVSTANISAASLAVDFSFLMGINPVAEISLGLSASNNEMKQLLSLSSPFSLAFGGAGGSYGGSGGKGYGINPIGPAYGDVFVRDLFGGSGGCMRGAYPFDTNGYSGIAVGKGGAGGGAIELIATDDIVIGSFGSITVSGGPGEQTSEGGGGGGSGGAILLSAGGSVVVEGSLDASGGFGAYGGSFTVGAEVSSNPVATSLSGGGGGGGRIALYGESISSNKGVINVSGGRCGKLNITQNNTVSLVSIVVQLLSPLPLSDQRLFYIVGEYFKFLIPNIYKMNSSMASASYVNKTYTATLHQDILLSILADNISIASNIVNSSSYSFIDVSIIDVQVTISPIIAEITETSFTPCSNQGGDGTIFTSAKSQQMIRVENTLGAEDTSRALHIQSQDSILTASGVLRESPYGNNGPVISFASSQPTRVTYYTKISSNINSTTKSKFGSLVTLTNRCTNCTESNSTTSIGVYFGDSIMHGNNFDNSVDERDFYKDMITIDNYTLLDKWYKIDIHIDWIKQVYYILLDDTLVVNDASFDGESFNTFSISTTYSIDVWYDEIYIGFDNTMRFKCPETSNTGSRVKGSSQYSWTEDEVNEPQTNGLTQYDKMSRHYSFFNPSHTIPFDGQGNTAFFQDYGFIEGVKQPELHAGALLFLTNSPRTAQIPGTISATTAKNNGRWWKTDSSQDSTRGRQFWYIEFDYASDLSETLNGGICACSSQDLLTWRFEGIVFHYTNLSDMVYGSSGPFHIEKPKVLLNNNTGMFVLWGVMDNNKHSLQSAVVLSSPNEDGPFYFRRSLYPDGNNTRDQAVYTTPQNKGALSRTYYQTIEYVLPEAMMQPIWESVKLRNGETNFRNNFHRTHYEIGYDNYHDIFLQRWRKEDKPWEVICIDKITKAERHVSENSIIACIDPTEYKVVIGQGSPHVKSNYVDSRDTENSWWMQSSVPAVSAQPWNSSVADGLCGLSKYDEDYDEFDPSLATFIPRDRSTCSNIADNPIHAAVQDKLIGIQKVVSRRRAKFIAVSGLTHDYLDTSGLLSSYEGELESGSLISLMNNVGDFGFTAQSEIRSTFSPPVLSEFSTADDYKIRFRQYVREHNDRSYYSLACIIDGVCPVNYRDQIKEGHL